MRKRLRRRPEGGPGGRIEWRRPESTVQGAQMRQHLEELARRGASSRTRDGSTALTSPRRSPRRSSSSRARRSTIAGRLMAIRGHGKAGFADSPGRRGRIQVYVRKDEIGEDAFELWKLLDVGDIVGVRGEVFRTRTGEVSVKAAEITLLAKALLPLPRSGTD